MTTDDERPLFLSPEEDDESWLDSLDSGDSDDSGEEGQESQESRESQESQESRDEPPAVDVFVLLTRYHRAQAPHERDEFWQGLEDAERAALAREGEAGPYHHDFETFTLPTPDKPDYADDRLKRAEQEAEAGADAIARGLLYVDEATFEAALDLRQDVERLAGRPRAEAILRLEDLVNRARVHAASVGTFDEDRVIARRSWTDSGYRHHEEQVDHRGRKREVVMSRRETAEALEASREARAERKRLRLASDASAELVDTLKTLESGGTLDLDTYLGMSMLDRTVLQRVMSPEQREALRRSAEYRAESE